MKVDIIIPAYYGTYLHEAIESCLNQSYKDIKITVVNNNSPVDIESICKKYSGINYIYSSENNGPSGGRNLGIKSTNAEIISFLDDDDIMTENKILYSINEFQKDNDIGMTCGNYRIFVDRKNLRPPFYKKVPIINWNTLMKQNLVATGSVSVRRSAIEKVGLFDERFWMAEDWDCWLRLTEHYKIKYIDEILYHYSWINKPNSSLTKRSDMLEQQKHNIEIIKKEAMLRTNNGKNIRYK